MLQANYTVITNVISDHLDVMGKDLDSIASAWQIQSLQWRFNSY